MVDKIVLNSLLYDFYGKLLTKKQQNVMSLYHEENLSLAEISEQFSISRQGVHDSLKSAEKALEDYEEKLGLVKKFIANQKVILDIDKKIDDTAKKNSADRETVKLLEELKEAIKSL